MVGIVIALLFSMLIGISQAHYVARTVVAPPDPGRAFDILLAHRLRDGEGVVAAFGASGCFPRQSSTHSRVGRTCVNAPDRSPGSSQVHS